MIKDFGTHKQIEKHARHVERAHRELSHHLGRLRESPTAGELFSLLSFQLRPRLSRHNEIKNCEKRGPAFAAKFPDHHSHASESESSLVKLIDCINPIIGKYYIPGTEEIDRERVLDPEDQRIILLALQSELEN
jgi:hypothetical protein